MQGHPKFFSIFVSFGAPMKLNQIAIASLVLVAGSSFAATAPLQCDKTSPEKFVNTCKPAATFFVAGSSALGGAISKVITASATTGAKGYFDTSVVPLVSIVDIGSKNGVSVANPTNAGKAGNGVSAWYGMSRAELTGGTSVPVLVVYNSYMGSAAGVSNVMAAPKLLANVPEADVVTVGPTGNVANTCTVVSANLPILGTTMTTDTKTFIAAASTKVACSSHAITRADIAISDVDANELVGMYDVLKGGVKLSALERTPLAMQGFAIGVNNVFYNALQAAQVTSGALPATCTAGTYTEACQPSITRAQYASLVTKEGSIKTAAGFIPGSTEVLTLARRDQLSGTQATSNIYFASDVCNILDAKSKVNTHGGALTLLRAADSTPNLVINENVQTGDVETDLKKTTGYSIGVIALSKGNSTSYKFVKLDGVSPNFAKNGTTFYGETALRNNMIDGSWGLQMTAYAMYPKAAGTYDAAKAPKANMIKQMVADLSDSTLHDLSAIGYFNGTTAKKSAVQRLNGNNCSPLINK